MRPLVISLACWVGLIIPEGACAAESRSNLVEEFFEGTEGQTPHPMQWGVSGGHVSLDGAGHLVFDTSSEFGHQSLSSTRAERPTNTAGYSVKFDNLTGQALWNMTLGFVESDTGALRNYILVRTDLGNSLWTVDICTDGQRSSWATGVPRSTLGTWTVEWRQDQVLVYLDGTLQFDSRNDPPQEGEDWRYPDHDLRPYIGGSGGQIMKMDGLIFEEIAVGGSP